MPRHNYRFGLRLLSCPFALLLACSLTAADLKPKPVLTMSLAATNNSFVVLPESGFRLEAFGNPSDWTVDVSRGDRRGALLYPQANWHGAHESQVSPWSHARAFYPDERIIRVRGYQRWVRLRLVNPTVSGEKGNETFTGGTLEIYWQESAKSPGPL